MLSLVLSENYVSRPKASGLYQYFRNSNHAMEDRLQYLNASIVVSTFWSTIRRQVWGFVLQRVRRLLF